MLGPSQYGQPGVLDPSASGGPIASQSHDQVVPLSYAVTGSDVIDSGSIGDVTGTAARTLGAFVSTASGTVTPPAITGTVAVTLGSFVPHASSSRFATAVSSNGRYLVDQLGAPYFISGNSPQNMVSVATLTGVASFFSDQRDRGFNSSQMHLVYNFAADAQTSTAPFSSNTTLATNSAYWGTIDSILDLAATYGFTIWGNVWDNISMGASITSVSDANCFAYGQFLGARYKTRPNLIWSFGNDFITSQWSARNGKYQQILAGIRDQGDTHPTTLWLDTETPDANTSWDTLNDLLLCYIYDTAPYDVTLPAYNLTRTGYPKPVYWGEGTYFGEHDSQAGSSSNLELRKLPWWTITAGGVGHFFGTHQVWQFGSWQTEQTTAAAIYSHLALIPTIFAGLNGWEKLVPDQTHVFQTGGRGTTGDLDTSTLATAAITADGLLAVVYFPTSRSGITFDTSKLAGTVTAYWVDPTSGSTSTVSNPAAPTHPGTNAGGDADWVLVFQGSNDRTGTSARTLGNFTSSASGTVTPPAFTGSSARTLGSFAPTASGSIGEQGTAASTLGSFTPTSSGTYTPPPITGTSAKTLGAFTPTASGTATPPSFTGTAAPVLGSFISTVSGSTTPPGFSGTAAPALSAFTSSASGAVTLPSFSGTAAPTLGSFVTTTTGQVGQVGTVGPTLSTFTSTASGSSTPPPITGVAASTLGSFAPNASGQVGQQGSTARTLGSFTAAVSGTFAPAGSGFGSPILSPFISTASGTRTIPSVTGTAAPTLNVFTSAASGTSTPPLVSGSSALTIGSFITTTSGQVGQQGAAATSLGSFVAAALGAAGTTSGGMLAVVLGNFVAVSSGKTGEAGGAAPLLASFVSSATGHVSLPTIVGTAAITLSPFQSNLVEATGDLMFDVVPSAVMIGTEVVEAIYFNGYRVWP